MVDPGRLTKLFGPVSLERASIKVLSKATFYPDFTRLFIPTNPYDKLQLGMEARTKLVKAKSKTEESSEPDLERSLRRTKKKIKDYVLCNKFELFATFTFKSDRQDTEKCKTKMSNWLKNQQKRQGRFDYLIVPEFHKDKKSLHFHALLKSYTGKLKGATNPKTGKSLRQKGRDIYTVPSYRSGFTNVIKIDDTPESHAKIGSYVRKYITKDMPLFFGKNRYWASYGLKLPATQENPPQWHLKIKPIRSYASEYGVTYDFLNRDIEGSK